MNLSEIDKIVAYIIENGYLIIFILALIEGPIITIAASIAAAMGYFDIGIILLLAIVGDIGGDAMYYYIGFYFQKLLQNSNKWSTRVKNSKFERLKTLTHTHPFKAILTVKLSPLFGQFGQIFLGSIKVPFPKFIIACSIIGSVKTVFFVLLGYFSVQFYYDINKTMMQTQYVIIIMTMLFFLIRYPYRNMLRKIMRKHF